jgi:hypothetical protein
VTIQHAVGLGHGVIERTVDDLLHEAAVLTSRVLCTGTDIHHALVQRALDLLQRDLGGWSRQLPAPAAPLA